ncbi:MAG: 50S ribosomal protein L18 [Candidatus Shapirobacteria bacterium]|nr:50S ribosomal protein L18 [Candidatus Shapirobacteria bacterium]
MINNNPKNRRLKRVRGKINLNLGIPRLSVFRSNQHIWAQIIDDKHGSTLVATSSKNLKDIKGTKSQKAALVGQEIAKLALTKKIINIRFDRGLYRYHGRVKALANGAREGGLKF